MNAYMGYSRDAGPEEGACLIFAHTVQEARKTGYPIVSGWWGIEFTDMAAKRLNAPHRLPKRIRKNLPPEYLTPSNARRHVIAVSTGVTNAPHNRRPKRSVGRPS
jgi:hypothetical protein